MYGSVTMGVVELRLPSISRVDLHYVGSFRCAREFSDWALMAASRLRGVALAFLTRNSV